MTCPFVTVIPLETKIFSISPDVKNFSSHLFTALSFPLLIICLLKSFFTSTIVFTRFFSATKSAFVKLPSLLPEFLPEQDISIANASEISRKCLIGLPFVIFQPFYRTRQKGPCRLYSHTDLICECCNNISSNYLNPRYICLQPDPSRTVQYLCP
ncbi:hypothetical protein DSECCO2_612910 [anaerobic digester metagenome]